MGLVVAKPLAGMVAVSKIGLKGFQLAVVSRPGGAGAIGEHNRQFWAAKEVMFYKKNRP